MPVTPHFDADALLDAVYEQPIGLACTTNHPAGFRRLLYLASTKRPARRVQILQSPTSAMMFYLVRNDVRLEEVMAPTEEIE